MQVDIGSEKVLVYDPVLLLVDPSSPFNLIGKPKVSQTGKAGVMKFMAPKGQPNWEKWILLNDLGNHIAMPFGFW